MPSLDNQKGFQNTFHHQGSLERCFCGGQIARMLLLYKGSALIKVHSTINWVSTEGRGKIKPEGRLDELITLFLEIFRHC